MASTLVLYTLKLGGDLAAKLPQIAAGLKRVGQAATDAKGRVGAAAAGMREGLNKAAEDAGQAAQGIGAVVAGFAAAGFAVHTLLKNQRDYEQSVTRLQIQAKKLGDALAEAIGPKVAKFIDSFTIGFTYLGTLLTGVVGPAFTTLLRIVDVFIERLSAALDAWKKLSHGDTSGARAMLQGHKDAIGEIIKSAEDGFKAIGEANDRAVMAAFAAWKKATDGIRDVIGGQSYRSAVTTISGYSDRTRAGNTQFLTPEQSAAIKVQEARRGRQTANDAALKNQQVTGDAPAAADEVVSGLDKATGAIEAVSTGVSGILGMIPIYGGFLASIWELVAHMSEISQNVVQEVIDVVVSLPDQMGDIIEKVPQMVIDAIPAMVLAIAKSFPQLILDLISSGPQLFAALLEAMASLPRLMVEGFRDMFNDFADKIRDAIERITGVLSDKEGRLGTGLGAKSEGDRRFLGIHIPKRHSGGPVFESGLHNLERGEYVMSRREVQGGGRMPSHVTIQVQGITSADHFVRQTRARLGSLGVGLSLVPRTVG